MHQRKGGIFKEMELTPELIEKIKGAKSSEELASLAKENGIELSVEKAKEYFAQFNPNQGELGDDELDNVSGGEQCGTIYSDGRPVVTCGNSCDYHTNSDWERCGGLCFSCVYYREDSGLYLCYCPERRNN